LRTCRYLKSAVAAEDLGELHALLQAGVITVPCLIAIRSALATTNTPIESRMGKKQGIMVLTSKYIETFDPRPDRGAVQVRLSLLSGCGMLIGSGCQVHDLSFRSSSCRRMLHNIRQLFAFLCSIPVLLAKGKVSHQGCKTHDEVLNVQSRDSIQNFLEVADSWNITDGMSHSLAVSRDVYCNNAPFKHSAYDRTVLHQGLLRAVATEAINYLLQRKTPVASVVHEQYMPVHEQVALVGELRVVPRGPALRPWTNNNISTILPAPFVYSACFIPNRMGPPVS
jgi:hypothetical protein